MIEISVNSKKTFNFERRNKRLADAEGDIVYELSSTGKDKFHLLLKNKSYPVEIVSIDHQQKTAILKVKSRIYEIAVRDQFDLLLKRLGMENLASAKLLELKAPMPGLVLKVLAQEGAYIKKGDNLLVLEAMKMENIIKASADGNIKSIKVNSGDKVEKNQLLVLFE